MARKYVNPAKSAPVGDKLLDEARVKAESAAARLREAERGDPLSPGWDTEYEAASAAARAASRRLEAIEQLRAAQLERGGQREAAVIAAEKDLESIAAGLSASRDQIAAAAAEHLRSLAALSAAVDAHNETLAAGRARVGALGLAVRDDLVDEGQEHDEGVIDGRGLRAGGRNWTPVPAPGLVIHALLQVFGLYRGPFSALRYAWPAHQTTARPDGLRLPSLVEEN